MRVADVVSRSDLLTRELTNPCHFSLFENGTEPSIFFCFVAQARWTFRKGRHPGKPAAKHNSLSQGASGRQGDALPGSVERIWGHGEKALTQPGPGAMEERIQ